MKEVQSFIVTGSSVNCVIHRHNLANKVGSGRGEAIDHEC